MVTKRSKVATGTVTTGEEKNGAIKYEQMYRNKNKKRREKI